MEIALYVGITLVLIAAVFFFCIKKGYVSIPALKKKFYGKRVWLTTDAGPSTDYISFCQSNFANWSSTLFLRMADSIQSITFRPDDFGDRNAFISNLNTIIHDITEFNKAIAVQPVYDTQTWLAKGDNADACSYIECCRGKNKSGETAFVRIGHDDKFVKIGIAEGETFEIFQKKLNRIVSTTEDFLKLMDKPKA